MNGSNLLGEADLKPSILCPICLRKLFYYVGPSISVARYMEDILRFKQGLRNPYFSREIEQLEKIGLALKTSSDQ